jgi:RecB family endonuclease NucS
LFNHIVQPAPEDALTFIQIHHQSKPEKTMLLIIGDCMINYHGRARSLLDWGERLIIIKQDGNVLVHQPTMREPVNWQPAGTTTRFRVHKDQLIMYSYHTHPNEKMKTTFRSIATIQVTTLYDNAKLRIAGMEQDIVNDILCNPTMIEEDLRICQREKQVKSGLIDLYGYDKDHNPVIIEVKRSQATISAVHQLRMYVNDLKGKGETPTVRGILCAPKIPDMVKHLLADYQLEWKEVERRVILPDDQQRTLETFHRGSP